MFPAPERQYGQNISFEPMRHNWRSSPAKPDQEIQRRVVDELMEHYVSWREACAAVSAAYEGYERAPRQEQRMAFGAYLAALDREALAAATYQGAVQRIAGLRAVGHGVG
jgi:hypothetical protein